jgi:hypothetical protein
LAIMERMSDMTYKIGQQQNPIIERINEIIAVCEF